MAEHYKLVPKDIAGNLAFRKKVLREAGKNKAFQKDILKMCEEDILFFTNVLVWTHDPRTELKKMPFITYEFQDESILSIVDSILNQYDVCIAKSRDMGASWCCLVAFYWLWRFGHGIDFLLMSRTQEYVDEQGNPKSLFWKLDFITRNLPKWAQCKYSRKTNLLENSSNGCTITGESTTEDAGRGGRWTALLLDEFAFFNTKSGFEALKSTRDASGCRVFNSTPKGADNAFYEAWTKFSRVRIEMKWTKHPSKNKGLYVSEENGDIVLLDKEYRAKMLIRRPEWDSAREVDFPETYPFVADGKIRSPWYDEQCCRCATEMEIAQELDINFLGSDYQFFDQRMMELIIAETSKPPSAVGFLDHDTNTCEPNGFSEHGEGNLFLWTELKNGVPPVRCKYIIGADVSAGTGASNSVASVIDASTGEKVAVYRNSKIRPIEFCTMVIALCKFFNNAYLIWDASGPTGKNFTLRIKEVFYDNIYMRTREDKLTRKSSDSPGYYLNSSEMKTALLEQYRKALVDRTFVNRSEYGLRECLQFVVVSGGKVEHVGSINTIDPTGAKSAHGDEVIADALACKAFGERGKSFSQKIPDVLYGSLAWRMKERKIAQNKVKSDNYLSGW